MLRENEEWSIGENNSGRNCSKLEHASISSFLTMEHSALWQGSAGKVEVKLLETWLDPIFFFSVDSNEN